ncbi:MAG: alanine:cation symporter family protein [Rickettsiales bacterium]|jgi:AGCS family alanine or glycine:cation symporter|nr:alanine:cation symporter family protein [Rickettsiales bacterium]
MLKPIEILDEVIFYNIGGFPALILVLICTGLFFSFYLKFPNITLFKHSIREATKGSSDSGLLKSKQSLFTSLSSIIGMGSVAGVAMAVRIGGPGAVIWLMIMVLFSMNTSFAETLLAVKYKSVNMEDKSIDCAPVRYIKESLSEINLKSFGVFLATVYGIMYFIGLIGTQMYQVREVTSLLMQFGPLANAKFVITILFDIIVILVILGGITNVAKILEKLLPAICGSYLISVIVILLFNLKRLPLAIWVMLREAFRLKSATGGIIGALCTGVQRGTFSNEAGLGTATTPYAAMESDNIVKPAGLGSMNPLFVGIVCLATGLIIVSSGIYLNPAVSDSGIVMVKNAFSTAFSWFPYVLCVIIPMLSLSLCISSAFNAQNVYQHYFGKKTTIIYFLIQFLLILSSAFTNPEDVMKIADVLYMSIAIPNIICLLLVREIIKKTYETNKNALFGDSGAGNVLSSPKSPEKSPEKSLPNSPESSKEESSSESSGSSSSDESS